MCVLPHQSAAFFLNDLKTYPRVLVVGFYWQAGAAAIASWMMTRRGMDRESKGLPFFRGDESLKEYINT